MLDCVNTELKTSPHTTLGLGSLWPPNISSSFPPSVQLNTEANNVAQVNITAEYKHKKITVVANVSCFGLTDLPAFWKLAIVCEFNSVTQVHVYYPRQWEYD